ncbi:inositol polyphosphate 1-phosphatase-like [Anneissia japonica]|uniref:inositol polyphosphate 1-phosphatase-like n=1 Tax=Anneissia japonica TaxID=1529436 RepID=UPI0014257CB9|nr:inositol polyphosphate 1-phosphatase-like [Anneissia japonica]
MATKFIQALLDLSEKAANLARIVRAEQSLFELLVQEKTGEDKNKRFVEDFKTLGDVLIQEMIRHDLNQEYPGLREYVFGEESNKFTNTLGESIVVEIQETQQETCQLLTKVLDGNSQAASLLANSVHQSVHVMPSPECADVQCEMDVNNIGIWIDPIDGTAEYIRGGVEEPSPDGIYQNGLPCAVILIGAFLRQTGEPIFGVINQPFSQLDKTSNIWSGRHLWGFCQQDIRVFATSNPIIPKTCKGIGLIMSKSEDEQIKECLVPITGDRQVYASGAGYKMLCVIEGLIDGYILSKGSTFKWDTCAPHAILKALGGGIIRLDKCLESVKSTENNTFDLDKVCIEYHKPDTPEYSTEGQKWCNTGGMLAYINREVAYQILNALCKNEII